MLYPLISVVIPVYNTSKFLDISIPSVLEQDYPNLEIIIGNNGSTDDSLSKIQKYSLMDSRIQYFTIKHVNTVKESRDNCIARAHGTWIIPVDSDDSISPGYISNLWKRCVETNSDMICAMMAFLDDRNEVFKTIPASGFNYLSIFTGEEAMFNILQYWMFGANGALMRRSIIDNLATDKGAEVFTDECDTRRYLYNCNTVAFAQDKYFVSYNSNSTGRKLSPTKINYPIVTNIGIYDFIKSKYSCNDKPYNISVQIVKGGFRYTVKTMLGRNYKYLRNMNLSSTIKWLDISLEIVNKEKRFSYTIERIIYNAMLSVVKLLYRAK